jgi:segregation and condensation protein A
VTEATDAKTETAKPEAPASGRALVNGEPVALPDDLYIPPEALEVFLRSFEGPLDLLLYLIRRKNLDILEIPIAEITRQYIQYIELMQDMRLDLAGEYLLMAAMLAEIKSRWLLPRPPAEEEEDNAEDPRAELIRRLLEYERFKKAAQDLDNLPRVDRDLFPARVWIDLEDLPELQPLASFDELVRAYQAVLGRAALRTDHQVQREPMSVADRMRRLSERLGDGQRHAFTSLLVLSEGRAGVVVCFLAILELLKAQRLEIIQNAPLAPIYVRQRGGQ